MAALPTSQGFTDYVVTRLTSGLTRRLLLESPAPVLPITMHCQLSDHTTSTARAAAAAAAAGSEI